MSDDNCEFHPIANLFPLIEGQDFERLCEDVKAFGLRQNIVLHEGKILDGRNRYRACRKTGQKARFIEYLGDDPFGYVAALNLFRRHLSPSQRAVIAAEMANMKRGDNQHTGGSATLLNLHTTTPPTQAISQAEAAERMNVSTRTVTSAAKILEQGSPELIEAVRADTVSVNAAAAISELPKPQQAKIVSEGPEVVADAAKAIREAKGPKPQTDRQNASQTDSEIMLRAWGRTNSFQRQRFLRLADPSVGVELSRLSLEGGGDA